MARVKFTARTEEAVTLVATTAKTILQLVAPANQRGDLRRMGVTFNGVNPTGTPVLVELMRQTTAGTSSAGTPKRDNPGAESIQFTSRITFTAEPTAGDVLREFLIHPQGGHIEVFDYGEIEIAGGERIGIRCTAPEGVNVRGFLSAEE